MSTLPQDAEPALVQEDEAEVEIEEDDVVDDAHQRNGKPPPPDGQVVEDKERLPIRDLERVFITRVIDLGALRPVVWAFRTEDPPPTTSQRRASHFESEECDAVWRWLISFSPGHHQVPTREQLRAKFPRFRFARQRNPIPLLDLAGRIFPMRELGRSAGRVVSL